MDAPHWHLKNAWRKSNVKIRLQYNHMDASHGENVRWELLKNAAFCLEQILEAVPYKTPAVLQLAYHFTNHSSKTNKTRKALLQKQRLTHKWHSLMDSCKKMCQCRPISKVLHQLCTNIRRNLEDLLEAIDDWEGWWEMVKKSVLSLQLYDDDDDDDIYIYI